MTTQAILTETELSVVPGTEATVPLIVINGSDIVESYRCEVVGDAAPWARVEPAALRLYPGAEGETTVHFAPPRSYRQPADAVPFAVRVIPAERPQTGAAAEGVVHVGPFADTTSEILPRLSRGRRRSRHEVAVDNRGNIPLRAALTATDPDDGMTIRIRPSLMTLPPGQAGFATVAVRHRKRLWRGQPVTRPFQVAVAPEHEPTQLLDASSMQQPVFSRASTRTAALVAAALALLVAAWFLLLKPAVRSAASDAVTKPLANVSSMADKADRDAKAAKDLAQNPSPAPAPVPSPSAAPGAANAGTTSVPFSTRLETIVGNGATSGSGGQTQFKVADKTTFQLTDLVLQNPQGDSGGLELLVDGKVILTVSLANFRDLDYHLVSPIEVPAGKVVSLRTRCVTAGPPLTGAANTCRIWVLISGGNRTAPAAAG
jgi:hypothetical protein